MSRTTILVGDSRLLLKDLADNSVDACVCDAPYELGFMGKGWDSTGVVYDKKLWAEVLRVLKPGGHLLAFGGTRTYHRMACAIEDAGFEIRDQIQWIYGSGFPKSHDVSKGIDKAAGVEREDKFEGSFERRSGPTGNKKCMVCGKWLVSGSPCMCPRPQDVAVTDAAKAWQGWGTALKPANEPICMARKPLSESTVAANVLKWGTGAINVDASRVGTTDDVSNHGRKATQNGWDPRLSGGQVQEKRPGQELGRWPANIVHDGSDEVIAAFPDAGGQQADASTDTGSPKTAGIYGAMKREGEASQDSENAGEVGFKMKPGVRRQDTGSAARFFYCAKASREDRDAGLEDFDKKSAGIRGRAGTHMTRREEGFEVGHRANTHPTVKPVSLMRWLVRMVTPPGGLVLDPFMGSGSTGKACACEGFDFTGMELSPEYAAIAEARIAAVLASGSEIVSATEVQDTPEAPVRVIGGQIGLFD